MGRDTACSALSTVAIRSLISVPEYKPTHFRLDGVMEDIAEKTTEGDPDLEPPSRVGEGQTARASKPVRSRITRVAPSSRISLFFFRSLNNRVTVSREEPMRCAISS